ncbi:Tlg2-vesicle protein [Puccinia graminis f. sp. tritici]|uniref:Golgi apparatus membrane protein TVP38 n=1 Tax=Puccinia graminis f. sp. tritici TaxID=56615 RepID=A0A5B0PJ22_PUCGR|nr:Tlg2-vesicle protein [Puccinia graminis f. sp. tritici]
MNQPLHYPPSSSSSTHHHHHQQHQQQHQQQQHSFELETSNHNNLHHEDFKPSSLDSKTSFRYKTYQTAFGPLSLNKFLRKEWIKYYVLLVLILIGIGVVAIYHHQIVIALHPFVQSMRNLKVNGVEVGWLIPVGVLFIISFPPLFGHEIVIILCGLVWGLWLGFAIVSLGTLLGELANYWTFKYLCSHRAAKLEKKDVNYACMCVVIREGGFWIAFLARLSAIPGHLVTPVFATTGMSLTIFTAATVISMPKQLAGVYLGTLFTDSSSKDNNNQDEGSGTGGTGEGGGGSTAVKYSVLAVSFLVTIVAALYIYKKMALARTRLFPDDQLPIVSRPSTANPPPLAPSSVGATAGGTSDRAGTDTRSYEHAPSPQRMPTTSSYESSSSSSTDLRADGPLAISPTLSSDDPSNPFTSHHHHQQQLFPSSFPSSPQDEVEEEDLHSGPAWAPIPLANPHQILHTHSRNPSDNRNPFVDPPYIPIVSSSASSPPLPLPDSAETGPPSYSARPPDSIPYSIPHRNRNF